MVEQIEQIAYISDAISLTKVKPQEKRKRALMLRAGGIGDCTILTVVAKELYNKGFDVDYFVGSPSGKVCELYENLPYIKSCKEIKRLNNIDCIEDEFKNLISVEIFKKEYDEVFDFKNSVESNRPVNVSDVSWRATINSNYQNWTNLSLAWANIDPYFVLNKIPEIGYKNEEKYAEWFKECGLKPKSERTHKIIAIQLTASSLVRTFYRASDLPDMLYKKYPGDIVLVFDNGSWFALNQFGRRKIEFDEELNPLIQSIQILKESDVFICADSGFSHIAAAFDIKCIGIYTTVPSWTRAEYYKNQVSIDAEAECRPCFTLDGFCPLERKKAYESLTERERDLIESANQKANIFEVAKKYKTVPKAIMEEHQSAQVKLQALSAKMPACVASITAEQILEKVGEVLQ